MKTTRLTETENWWRERVWAEYEHIAKNVHERELFLAASEIGDATQRLAYLNTACGNDPALRDRVGLLLRCSIEAGDFLEEPAADLCSDGDVGMFAKTGERGVDDDPPTIIGHVGDTERTFPEKSADATTSASRTNVVGALSTRVTEETSTMGTLFGRYRIERVLGLGGMGIVCLAEDLRLGRRVL